MKQETPQPRYEEGFVEVSGVRVYYLHAGRGEPMVLIHGLVGSSADWRRNLDALAAQGSVYAIDLLNMGRSERVGGLDTTLGATANRVAAIMDALGLAAADIVGHSHGGAVALMLAALYPERVRRLILFAPANPYNRSSDTVVRLYSTWWGGLMAWLVPYLPASIQRHALGGMYGRAARVVDSDLEEIAACLRNRGSLRHVLRITRGWFAEEAKLRAALRRVRHVPTLLVWGDRDCTVSLNSGIRLKRRLRAAELVVLPGCGHAVFEQAPEEANRIMLEWLGRHPLSASKPQTRRRAVSLSRRSKRAAAVRQLVPMDLRLQLQGETAHGGQGGSAASVPSRSRAS